VTDFPRVELAPGYSVSRVINGCWQLSPDHGGGPSSEREIFRSFSERVEHGFTTFDCADIYTGVEALLGRFRRTLADPGTIEVHTKYVPDRATLGKLTGKQIDEAVERSLTRLGVERLDLLQFHWWDYAVPGLERMLERLLRAREAGKIRHLGATNFDTAHIRELQAQGAGLVSLQAQYSLLDRRPERQMLALAESAGPRILAYGALAGGFLSGRWLGSEPDGAGNRSLTKYRLIIDEAGGWDRFQALLHLLDGIAGKHGVPISTVATCWVLDRPGVAAVILGVGKRARAVENHRLADFVLDEDDRSAIDAFLDRQPVPPGDMYALERDPFGRHSAIIKTDINSAAEGGAA